MVTAGLTCAILSSILITKHQRQKEQLKKQKNNVF